LFLGTSTLSATHIVGGEMTYQRTGTNTYKIRLDLYIDCLNGNSQAIASDATAIFGIFNGNTKKMLSGYPISVSRKGPLRVQKIVLPLHQMPVLIIIGMKPMLPCHLL
jgi:hypothetical protein